MYNNPYYMQMNNQNNLDQNYLNMLDKEKERLEKMRDQYVNRMHQPVQPITQNFQIAPTNREVIKYAGSIDEVQKEMVVGDTPYFSKDMSVVWVKNTKGDIKTYELNEIVAKDEKDLQIEFLQSQIEELKGMINNDANVSNDDAEQDTTNTTTNDESTRTTIKKSKSSSIQKVSRSKKEQ